MKTIIKNRNDLKDFLDRHTWLETKTSVGVIKDKEVEIRLSFNIHKSLTIEVITNEINYTYEYKTLVRDSNERICILLSNIILLY